MDNSQRFIYVNGKFVTEAQATISVFDRGFLFADGVYEVTAVLHGKMVENIPHLQRLKRSLAAIKLTPPLSQEGIIAVQKELISLNNLKEGIIYLQVTRGAAERDFAFPKKASPSMIAFTQQKNLLNSPVAEKGMQIITLPDLRWGRPDIKTVGLLASSMAKMAAIEKQKDDAWLVDAKGFITEATASNAYIVTQDNRIITRHLSTAILPGITRNSLLELIKAKKITLEERPFSVKEAMEAKEAFMTGSAAFVVPIVAINDQQIGTGTPGPVTQQLRRLYVKMALEQTGDA